MYICPDIGLTNAKSIRGCDVVAKPRDACIAYTYSLGLHGDCDEVMRSVIAELVLPGFCAAWPG